MQAQSPRPGYFHAADARCLSSFRRRGTKFNVIQKGMFFAVRNSLHTDLVSRSMGKAGNSAPGGRIPARLDCGKMIVGNPFIHPLVAHKNPELGFAVILIEVLHIYLIPSRGPVETKGSRAA